MLHVEPSFEIMMMTRLHQNRFIRLHTTNPPIQHAVLQHRQPLSVTTPNLKPKRSGTLELARSAGGAVTLVATVVNATAEQRRRVSLEGFERHRAVERRVST